MVSYTTANIVWRDGMPYSTEFEDVYFSTNPDHAQQGVEETQYVFLQHNQLAERWSKLGQDSKNTKPAFTVIETGFGSGLNFLCAVDLWLKTTQDNAKLNFISFELAPFSLQDLQLAHATWPQFSSVSQALFAQYHDLHTGMVQLNIIPNRVQLTLYIGEIADYLPKLDTAADAWFLDGFAPAKNPKMWQPYLYEHMMRCSHTETTFATFTSAGLVRRGLEAVGFKVRKATGYGKKREMLYGYIPSGSMMQSEAPKPSQSNDKHVVVIGAGIAGCATAYFLAQHGFLVTLLEQASEIAAGASGNPRGVLYPRLSGQGDTHDDFALTSLAFSLQTYAQLGLLDNDWQPCGVLQLAFNDKEAKRLQNIVQRYANDNLQWLNPTQASRIAKISLKHDTLYFANSGWVNPRAACAAFCHHPNITLLTEHQVSQLSQQAGLWQLTVKHPSNMRQMTADAVVIANAYDAKQLAQTAHLPLQAVRGQMSVIRANQNSELLATVLCADGYMTPDLHGQHAIGATFSPDTADTALRSNDDLQNLNMMHGLCTNFTQDFNAIITSRASIRCASTDYWPMVGEMVDAEALRANLPKHASQVFHPPMCASLYVNIAHGSKGLSTAPYCAQLLALHIAQSFGIDLLQTAQDAIIKALNPNRHLYKQLGLKRLLK